jgi:hypothetical protein
LLFADFLFWPCVTLANCSFVGINLLIHPKKKKEKNREDLVHSQVNGLITSGDKKLAIDSTPAINPCVFPCKIEDK